MSDMPNLHGLELTAKWMRVLQLRGDKSLELKTDYGIAIDLLAAGMEWSTAKTLEWIENKAREVVE